MIKVHVIFKNKGRNEVSASIYLNGATVAYQHVHGPSGADALGRLLFRTSLYEEHTGKHGPGSIDLLCLPFELTTSWS